MVAVERSLISSRNLAESRRVVVVLGPGRSGTSLLMQVLKALGMSTSAQMIPGSGTNPGGFYEDKEIVDAHKELLATLGGHPAAPLPEGWLESQAAKRMRDRLRGIVRDRLKGCTGIWGFKDPRSSNFMPLWTSVFDTPGIVPVYVLAMRNPNDVMASLASQTNRNSAVNELLWLQRTVESLYWSGGNCFVLHYEDWFSRPSELARELADYSGLNGPRTHDVASGIAHIVRSEWNRAVYWSKGTVIRNRCVRDLYDVLTDASGSDFDRDKVMGVVRDVREMIDGFSVWRAFPGKKGEGMVEKIGCVSEDLDVEVHAKEMDQSEMQAAYESVRSDAESLVQENGKYLNAIKELNDEVEFLRRENLGLQKENERLAREAGSEKQNSQRGSGRKQFDARESGPRRDVRYNDVSRLQKELHDVRESYSFRIGQVFVNAIAKPGKNTVLLPFNFVRIVLEYVLRR